MDIVELNEEITKQDPAAAAVAQINEAQANGEDNVFIRDVAVDINSLKSPTDLSSFLGKYIGWAISGSGDEKQAFRSLWGVLLSTDGGYTKQGIDDSMLFNAVSNAMQSYNGTEPSIEEVEVIFNEFGYYADLVKSKARVANGEETLDMPESPAGAMYRLLATMAGPNTTSLYRGIQIPLDSDNLSAYEEGQTLSLDPRSFSDDKALAGKFAGAFGGNEDKAAVIFTIPAGKGNVAKVDNISMFEDEREQLAVHREAAARAESVGLLVLPVGSVARPPDGQRRTVFRGPDGQAHAIEEEALNQVMVLPLELLEHLVAHAILAHRAPPGIPDDDVRRPVHEPDPSRMHL
jgi:hypothetical protein